MHFSVFSIVSAKMVKRCKEVFVNFHDLTIFFKVSTLFLQRLRGFQDKPSVYDINISAGNYS